MRSPRRMPPARRACRGGESGDCLRPACRSAHRVRPRLRQPKGSRRCRSTLRGCARQPAYSPDGGEWTDNGRETKTYLVAADNPIPGRLKILFELAKHAIKVFRSENWPPDLFGEIRDRNTVTVTT